MSESMCDFCGAMSSDLVVIESLNPDTEDVWLSCCSCRAYVDAARDYQEAKRANPEAPHYGLKPFGVPVLPLYHHCSCGDLAAAGHAWCEKCCKASGIHFQEEPGQRCECGATKTGCKDFGPGHSDWCPAKEK